MPFAIDKIIVNGNETDGTNKLIGSEYDSLNHLGAEIEENGWAAETAGVQAELEKLCAAHYQAQMDYYHGLRAIRFRLSAWVNDKLKGGNSQP